MRHLPVSVAIELAEGAGDPESRRHAERCTRCSATVRRFDVLFRALRPQEGALPEGLAAWARAYARTAAFQPSRVSVLRFLAGGSQPVPAVRNGLRAEAALLFGDERHQLDLRLEPVAGGRVRVHGQIVPLQGDPAAPWRIDLVTAAGEVVTGATDDSGEFWLDGVLLGAVGSLLAHNSEERIVVPRLESAEGRDAEA